MLTQDQAEQRFPKISRRVALKGLVGVVLTLSGVSCSQSNTPVRSPTSTVPSPTVSPTASRPAAVGETVYTYTKHSDVVNAVAWSLDGRRIASGSGDSSVQIWDALTAGNIFTYKEGQTLAVNTVAWSPNGKRIASGSSDQSVHVWDVATGQHMYTKSDYHSYVYWVAWSPDGQRLASASDDYTAHVWNAATGQNILIYRGHHREVLTVLWSPDSKHLTSGSFDTTVQEWDATTGRHILTIPAGAGHFIFAVAQSPNGRRLASGGQDQLVKEWDAATGNNLFTNSGHFTADTSDTPNQLGGTIFALAYSPDGRYLASASHDTTVQIILAKA